MAEQQFSILINCVVKAADEAQAKHLVQERFIADLQQWFLEDRRANGQQPYPLGTLLYYAVITPSERKG